MDTNNNRFDAWIYKPSCIYTVLAVAVGYIACLSYYLIRCDGQF